MDQLLARLDRSRLRILCGRHSCRGQLGQIRTMEEVVTSRRTGAPEHITIRTFEFPRGWTPDSKSGVWSLSKRSRIAIRHGYKPGYRRSIINPLPDGVTVHDFEHSLGIEQPLPVQAGCPRCGTVNRVDAEPLGVDNDASVDEWLIATP